MNNKPIPSPMMSHYITTKEKYKEAILFYRLGDFYEMFYEDAILVSKLLDLTLTGKNCGLKERAPMCGIPFHSAETYIAKLLKLGYKIAICEQLTEATKGKQVDRDVVRVITPGTITSDIMLDEQKNNYILCVYRDNDKIGVSYADISTGDFFTTEYKQDAFANLNNLITQLQPAEIICNFMGKETIKNLPVNKIQKNYQPYSYLDKSFELDNAIITLKNHFGPTVLSVFELNSTPCSIIASGALLDYLNDTQKIALKQIQKITKIDNAKFMVLDSIARRNLEITETIREQKKTGTLLWVLDKTETAMGSRLLRQWLEQPLKNSLEINGRLDSVEELASNTILRDKIKNLLKDIGDIERLTSKIGMQSIMPRDLLKLMQGLQLIPNLKHILTSVQTNKLRSVYNDLNELSEVKDLIFYSIDPEGSGHLKDGHNIKKGFNKDLDEIRDITTNSHEVMSQFEASEKERTGISSLKINFNRVYGYYIEIAKDLANQVPVDYHRKQTVANFDRYFNSELKELENKILTAEDSSIKLELAIYNEIRQKLLAFIAPLQQTAKAIATLDCLLSLAVIAQENNYVRPEISENVKEINIVNGRHPVVENYLKNNEFIPNDTYINSDTDKILVITGPNMAGKSTYMRQVAIITLMAHIGSFVPASSARISIIDRIFTRVGASDDLASGQSTFMVEMMEMANIIQNATDDSLIILDEIGRGTSTFDGLSIAWAIVEYFSKKKAKVLFATHYHELTELEGLIGGIKNYKISVKEFNNSIIFLRRIVRGGANRSFGIEVASLAGLPDDIITRAKEISHNIAEQDFNSKIVENSVSVEKKEEVADTRVMQIISLLKGININKISPMEAFEILNDLSSKLQ